VSRTSLRPSAALEAGLAAALGAHVFAVVLGQTRVFSLLELGWRLRWVTLALAFAIAVVLALAVRPPWPRRPLALPLALAGACVAFAFDSAFWSVRPEFTVPRAIAFALLLGTGAAASLVAAARPSTLRWGTLGLLGGAALVALSGLVVLLVDYDSALEAATLQSPARYNGLGGNPNTAAVLEALSLPIALWLVTGPYRRSVQRAGAALVLLFAGSIVASGSRGAAVAAAAGAVVPLLARAANRRARLLAVGAVAGALVAGILVTQLPEPSSAAPPAGPRPPSHVRNAELVVPLSEELSSPKPRSKPFRRSLFSSAGRFPALRGALRQGLERPVLGFGFGTEDKVFVDRYSLFFASRPENAYVGTFLQVGILGLALVAAFFASVLAQLRRALRSREATLAASLAGVVVAGLVVATSQSFALSVGASGAATFWICAFLLAGAAAEPT
jgi:O-Antigen ligase